MIGGSCIFVEMRSRVEFICNCVKGARDNDSSSVVPARPISLDDGFTRPAAAALLNLGHYSISVHFYGGCAIYYVDPDWGK